MAEICFQKAPGQDLAQNGRFPRIPEGAFNCRPLGPQMGEICFQKAPFEAKMKHFEAKTKHSEAKMKHFEAKMKHFEAKMKHFEI